MTNTPSLLPCPFCGCEARRSSGGEWYGTGCGGKQSCPAYLRGLMHRTQEGADAEWNRRIPQPVPLSQQDLRTRFEALARDSNSFKRSRRDCYTNPAVARDWKWFRLGVTAATEGKNP